jgi:flagellar motor protein MotB
MREIVVDFPEDAFSKGGFEVKSGLKNDLKLVLSKILPFKDEVTLNFIGHTDTVPLKKRNETNKIINSNLILSNLRAGRAAELAIQMSFQPEFISSQGVAEYSRNTRSLSLSIRARSASDSKEKTK